VPAATDKGYGCPPAATRAGLRHTTARPPHPNRHPWTSGPGCPAPSRHIRRRKAAKQARGRPQRRTNVPTARPKAGCRSHAASLPTGPRPLLPGRPKDPRDHPTGRGRGRPRVESCIRAAAPRTPQARRTGTPAARSTGAGQQPAGRARGAPAARRHSCCNRGDGRSCDRRSHSSRIRSPQRRESRLRAAVRRLLQST